MRTYKRARNFAGFRYRSTQPTFLLTLLMLGGLNKINIVQNATLAYNQLSQWQAHNEPDLLLAHRTLND